MAFHDLTISAVRPVAEDAVAISFEVPADLAERFSYRPGQFLTLRAEVGGEDIRRSYSIAAGPGEALTVGVRRVEGGRFSAFAQELAPGAHLQVMEPEGRFTCEADERILLIAAGSGITPMIAIAAHALARGAEVTLVYGNRTVSSIMFRREIEALKDRYLSRFSVHHLLSREAGDVPLLTGRIDGAKVSDLAEKGVIAPREADGIYLCGPGAMIAEARAALEALGVEPARIHAERFSVEGAPAPAPRSRAAEAAAAAGVEVEVLLDGTRRRFRMEAGDASVVDAAARAGLELPYSCKGGMCSTCRCRVVEGGAEMALNYALEPWETEAGFTLACQSRPTSARLVLDFDAA